MKLSARLLFWGILILVGWIAGDRYGAPQWMTIPGDAALGAIRNLVGAEKTEIEETATAEETEPEAEKSKDETKTTVSSQAAAEGGVAENANLRINEAGLQIIKDSEGLRTEAYSGPGGQYIGYGHKIKPGEKTSITEAEAAALLRQDARAAEDGVRSRLTRAANENEFSAMVSLAYNLGVGGFSRSPVLEKFNAGDKRGAADAFLGHNRGGGVILEHLTERREKERALFLTPV